MKNSEYRQTETICLDIKSYFAVATFVVVQISEAVHIMRKN